MNTYLERGTIDTKWMHACVYNRQTQEHTVTEKLRNEKKSDDRTN